jgi:RNA polymerase sigma-70 factor, ECF subfamily
MDEHDRLAERFEEHRSHLRAVAYRMLGSLSEADDAVQETWLRLSRSDTGNVDNLGGWLTTVVARVCLDVLRSRRSRREEPLGPERLPEPIVSAQDGVDPEQQALLAEGVGLALLVVLDTLAPAERLAFVLHDLFAVPFDEIAPIVGRSPTATRQLASRARRRVQGAGAVPDADLASQQAVVEAFLAPRGVATSTRCCRCSTPTWCCGRTRVVCPGGAGWCCAAPGRWPSRPSASRGVLR